MKRFGPKAFLSANVLNWGPYYAREVRKAINGTWKSQDFWGSLAEGSLKLAPYGKSVPRSLRALVNKRLAGFKARKFNPFKGPIRDQSGKVRVRAGKTMTFRQIVNWNWYVRGVQGKLPS
jgi:basic membrane lipoprotein Med (substrate-binding protein (PBP1-ABC) superfamily)